MAQKRKPIKEVVTRYVEEDDEASVRPPIDEFDPAEDSFSQFRQKFGTEGVVVKIYRRTPRGVQYCFSGVPSEIDEEVVRLYHSKQSYAGEEGQYAARCFVNGEGRDSFPILIAPQIASHDGGMAHGASSQSEVVRLLMAQNERLEQRLNAQQQVEREPLSSLADAMVKLQSLQPRAELPLDALMKAVELGRALSGKDSDASEWGPILKEALSHAGPAIGALLGGLSKPRGAPELPPASTGGAVENGAPEVQMEVMLRQALALLKRKCLAGSDPGLYIDLILDNRDDATYQRLIHTILTQPFSAFVQIDSELGKPPHEAFFTSIYNGIREAFSGQDNVEVDSSEQGGDKGNPAGDVASRKKSK